MRRVHHMPFGAQPLKEGGVQFALWAPGVESVDLLVDDLRGQRRTVPMRPRGDGWFQVEVRRAGHGTRYRYRLPDGLQVPDPASRFQPDDVDGDSEVVEPGSYRWTVADWCGRPWEEAVFYELHIGTFTPGGTFRAAIDRLDHLVDLGITAVELMPVADFAGARNWGYDGALLFAPDSRYGRPEDLKALIDAAHGRGLMVFIDVVYNHFGPEGNYLGRYAPQFFKPADATPWGPALNFDGPDADVVRCFFIDNALYWLEEFHADGLRLDAVHAIRDRSDPDLITAIAQTVRRRTGVERRVHLVLENDRNEARRLERDGEGRPVFFTAQWNDDIHHAVHTLLTGEREGYYAEFAERPAACLARALASGYVFQGEAQRDGVPRGEPSGHLPATAFVSFLQNHDQIGNRALGERITHLAPPEAVRAALALLLLVPQIPLLFMGEEWASVRPFPFFCDYGPHLADAVREGRRGEFRSFPQFRTADARRSIPDPNAEDTFASAVLDWDAAAAGGAGWMAFYRTLLDLRRREIVPRLARMPPGGHAVAFGPAAVRGDWQLGDGSHLAVLANLGATPAGQALRPRGRLLFTSRVGLTGPAGDRLPPWTTLWFLDEDSTHRGLGGTHVPVSNLEDRR